MAEKRVAAKNHGIFVKEIVYQLANQISENMKNRLDHCLPVVSCEQDHHPQQIAPPKLQRGGVQLALLTVGRIKCGRPPIYEPLRQAPAVMRKMTPTIHRGAGGNSKLRCLSNDRKTHIIRVVDMRSWELHDPLVCPGGPLLFAPISPLWHRMPLLEIP